MEADSLFELSRKTLRFGGIFITYENSIKGTLKKIFTYFVIVSFIWGSIGQTHYVFTHLNDFTAITVSFCEKVFPVFFPVLTQEFLKMDFMNKMTIDWYHFSQTQCSKINFHKNLNKNKIQ